MKWVSYSWTVVHGLITVAIAVAVLSHFTAPFERIVVDLLLLLYTLIQGGFILECLVQIDREALNLKRFDALMTATGSAEHQSPHELQVRATGEEKMNRDGAKASINAIVNLLVYLAVLWSLVNDLVA